MTFYRYDKLREVLKSRSKVVDMLKHRLEEITQFLAQLLENGDDTLNISTISVQLKVRISLIPKLIDIYIGR